MSSILKILKKSEIFSSLVLLAILDYFHIIQLCRERKFWNNYFLISCAVYKTGQTHLQVENRKNVYSDWTSFLDNDEDQTA